MTSDDELSAAERAARRRRRKKKRAKERRRARTTEVTCPFCGEADVLAVDGGGGDHQEYIEDCAVCCRPRVVHVEPGDTPGAVVVWVERGD